MNYENSTHKQNSKKGNLRLRDYSIYFEETPPTVFRNKWLKSLSKKTRKFKLNLN